MDCQKMIRHALVDRNIAASELSRQMGKTKNYISSVLHKPGSLQVDTLEAIAAAMGYKLDVAFVDEETGKRIEA